MVVEDDLTVSDDLALCDDFECHGIPLEQVMVPTHLYSNGTLNLVSDHSMHEVAVAVELEYLFPGTPMDLGTLPDRPLCDPRHVSQVVSEAQSKSPAAGESTALVRQPTLNSEMSENDSEVEEESDDDDIPNNEWSGANDNIEAALFQAVYPDLKLAAHLISTMYPTIVLSYKNKISSKVYSWQEKNIATCGTDSGTTTTAKETSPQGTSYGANKPSPKRDRQSSSHDDVGDEEDDDVDDFRRKRRKEKGVNNEPMVPELRLACPFYKKDFVKYSAAQSKHKSCAGPGYLTITSLKEHLKRVHRPVQCARCYQIFPFKGVPRSSAIGELAKHLRQERRCEENPDSMKEGIDDAEWSRLSEEKKTQKGKGKRKVPTPEKPRSALEQWYEIWVILFPGIEAPPTPWYETPFFASTASSPSQGQQHFLFVLETVGRQKLPEVRAAAVTGTNEDLLAVILSLGQKTYSTCAATYSLTADASTSSFSNINGSDPFSSSGSGSWQPVDGEPTLPVPIYQISISVLKLITREMNVDRNPQTVSENAPYVGISQNGANNYNYTPVTSGYPAAGQNAYHNPPSDQITYPDIPSRQAAYPDGQNPTSTEMPENMWQSNMFDLTSQAEFDMNAPFPTGIPDIPNSSNLPTRWGDQVFGPNYRGFGGAP
ncbi:hypothetical protein DL98DRAFT_661547 [Cadophora sp. DSE1049]|nr:hypothetical protein DL98DRAFT_661547 [Cadophora sp. DSE1049]